MENESKYAGMTVNERLYVSGNLTDFDKSVQKQDVEKVIEILMRVELKDSSIEPILKELGLKRSLE